MLIVVSAMNFVIVMTEQIDSSKGLTIEVWTSAKGEKQWRVKASDQDPTIVREYLIKSIEVLKEQFNIEVK